MYKLIILFLNMGKLIDSSKEELEKILKSEEGVVIVDFWANWCGPCKLLGPTLEQVSQESNVTVVKINVESGENSQLASEMGIKSIPAVFIYKNGEQVDKFVGVKSKDSILEIINKNLSESNE